LIDGRICGFVPGVPGLTRLYPGKLGHIRANQHIRVNPGTSARNILSTIAIPMQVFVVFTRSLLKHSIAALAASVK
jgi:hypothetical protein